MIEENKPEEVSKPDNKKEEVSLNIGFVKKKGFWQALSIIFIILFIVSLFFMGSSGSEITKTEAKARVQTYIDLILQERASEVSLGEVIDEGGLYRVDVALPPAVPGELTGQVINSYVSKDGKLFFPTAVDLEALDQLVLPPIDQQPTVVGDEEVVPLN